MPYVGQDAGFHSDNSSGVLTDLSSKTTNVAPTFNTELHDATTYGDDWREFESGLHDGTIAVNLFADEVTDLHMFGIMGREVSLQFDPYGVGRGKTRITCEGYLESWALADPVDGLVTKTATFRASGAVTVVGQT